MIMDALLSRSAFLALFSFLAAFYVLLKLRLSNPRPRPEPLEPSRTATDLAATDDPDALTPLIEEAARTLDRRNVDALGRLLAHRDPRIAAAAANVLGLIGDERALSYLFASVGRLEQELATGAPPEDAVPAEQPPVAEATVDASLVEAPPADRPAPTPPRAGAAPQAFPGLGTRTARGRTAAEILNRRKGAPPPPVLRAPDPDPDDDVRAPGDLPELTWPDPTEGARILSQYAKPGDAAVGQVLSLMALAGDREAAAQYRYFALKNLELILPDSPPLAEPGPARQGPTPESLARELGLLLTDTNPQIRYAAVSVLEVVRVGDVADYIEGSLSDPNQHVRARAVMALAGVAPGRARKHLFSLLSDADPQVRRAAQRTLDELDRD